MHLIRIGQYIVFIFVSVLYFYNNYYVKIIVFYPNEDDEI